MLRRHLHQLDIGLEGQGERDHHASTHSLRLIQVAEGCLVNLIDLERFFPPFSMKSTMFATVDLVGVQP
jgi:hypothetical protein